MAQTATLLEHWGYHSGDFAGQVVVDLGAGSRLRSRFFADARIAAIEPLADEFTRRLEWSDLRDAWRVYRCPAEERVPELVGQARLVMCMNVLDHVYDYRAVLDNVRDMLAPGGEFLLSVDLHEPGQAGLMHPVHLDRDEVRESLATRGLRILREWAGLPLPGGDSYGHGEAFTVVSVKRDGA